MQRRIALAPVIAAVVAIGLVRITVASGETPVRIPDQAVYDLAGAIDEGAETTAESLARTIKSVADLDIVVVADDVAETFTDAAAVDRATQLGLDMTVGSGFDGGGAVLFIGVRPDDCGRAAVALIATDDAATVLPDTARRSIVVRDMQPLIATCDVDSAVLVALGRIATTALDPSLGGPGSDDPGLTAGPPFPEPVDGVRVYDQAGIFRPETIATVARTIAAIEDRTGAEVVVYSQVVEDGRTTEEADRDARALMDEWGVGRKGFDDGLVILFDMYPGLEHGQVILYGGPGYRAAFLDNGEKQRIFDTDMLPLLKAGDLDGALLVAIEKVDANATPEHAATLERARQIDAAAGLIGAPLALILVAGSAMWSWLRFGRDPVYLDDPSIHMAGPPASLTPAAAVFVQAGRSTRRALTTALIDLASRGIIAFRQESHLLGLQKKVGITTEPPEPDPVTSARQRRNSARSLGRAERIIADKLTSLGSHSDGYIEPDHLPELAPTVPSFDKALESEVVRSGWFREPPSKATERWQIRGWIAFVAGIGGIVGGASIPSNGLLLVGIAVVVGAAVVLLISRSMPAVTLPGAMIRAMLAAYRRTLKKTMDQARSMDQVVAESGLSWLETPDQAVVWGLALGLHDEIEAVIGRSIEDLEAGRAVAGSTYVPAWFGGSSGGLTSSSDVAGGGSGSGGLFSSSSIPSFGGMFSALGSIGSAPGSSGGGSGGGFGGGGSGGGGGGSGGGF